MNHIAGGVCLCSGIGPKTRGLLIPYLEFAPIHDVQRQYRSLFVSLLGVAIVTHFVVIRFVIPSLDPKSPNGFFLMQTMIYTSIVVLPLFIFEKWAWKWFNRQIDLTGPWQ